MIRRVGMLWLVLVLACDVQAAAPPGKTRNLTAEEEKEVDLLEELFSRHFAVGAFEQVAKVALQIADYRRQRQGARHWQATDARFAVDNWRRLTEVPNPFRAEVVRAQSLNTEGVGLCKRGRPREAEKPLRHALAIRDKVLGKDHPETAHIYNNLAHCLSEQGKVVEALRLFRQALEILEKVLGRDHRYTAHSYNGIAICLNAQGKAAEALPLLRRALEITEKVLGKEHPQTANGYNNVAYSLEALGKSAEALPLFRKALQIYETVSGPEDPNTALGYTNIGSCLMSQGQAAEALPLLRRALEINEKVLGRDHPHTAIAYNNLGNLLNALGQVGEALLLHRRAMQIRIKVLGSEHPHTATSYHGLASCLNEQGKAAEALPLLRRALEINEKVLGKEHPDTALTYYSLAFCLHAQGKSAEALPLFRRALLIFEKVFGRENARTARCHHGVASCLEVQGKTAEALREYRQAVEILEKVLGREHPNTVTGYNNVASCLNALGKSTEAMLLFRQALQLNEKLLGLEHPDTLTSYNNVALCLWKGARLNEAVRLWQQSSHVQQSVRVLRAESGFDRAFGGTERISPQEALAVGLARLGQPRNAFRHAEASLARGLLDDLSPLSPAERRRIAELRTSMAKLDPLLASFASGNDLSDEQRTRQTQAKQEYSRFSGQLTDLLARVSARTVLPLERIQNATPADSALVLWVERLGERWACVVRAEGPPRWERLGKLDAAEQTGQLYATLRNPDSAIAHRQNLLALFRKERLDPLRAHLKGAKRLFVVPTGDLAYIPADLLADDFAVRYVPSGSVLARTAENHRALDTSSLLALGDPIFDKAPPAEPPASGVLVLTVLPNTFAAKAGLQSGDVLLSIGKTTLESIDDIQGALSSLPANADVWRDGKTFTVRLQGSPLGAVFDNRSARAAVRAWRRERNAVAQRATGHKRLPGTRLEVEAISGMVKGSTSLLGSDASEQKLDDLLASGKLKHYRILHFATHGEPHLQIPKFTSLILAQDNLPDPLERAKAGLHIYDGRLTVSRIQTEWKGKIDADLVVLSACQTGIGKDGGGEGLLGFAQAFLSVGARSVVLSRWKVDDTATSLLMIRFYENLLGKRKGVKPMGRAAALDEAKKWLRTLPRKEAERLATLHSGGVLRGSEGTEKTPDKVKKIEYKGDTPFAHPYYWAAWTLIGDPD